MSQHLLKIACFSTLILTSEFSYSAFFIHDEKNNLDCQFSVNEYGYAESEEAAPKGSGLCWRKEIVDKADSYIKENKLRHTQPPTTFDIAVDMSNVCNFGGEGAVSGDLGGAASKYLAVISRYSGNAEAIKKLSSAYDYGRLSAKSPRDCISYVTGR
jgi:hypothetical protein